MLNFKLCSGLTLYAPIAAFLGWRVHSWVPWMAQKSFYAGLIGGGFCLVWAVLAWLGCRVRAGAFVSLMVMALLFITDTLEMWEARGATKMSAVLTVLSMLTVLLLTALARNSGGPPLQGEPPHGEL